GCVRHWLAGAVANWLGTRARFEKQDSRRRSCLGFRRDWRAGGEAGMMRGAMLRGDSYETRRSCVGLWFGLAWGWAAFRAAAAGNSVYLRAGFSEIAAGHLFGRSGGRGGEFEGARICFLAGQ